MLKAEAHEAMETPEEEAQEPSPEMVKCPKCGFEFDADQHYAQDQQASPEESAKAEAVQAVKDKMAKYSQE